MSSITADIRNPHSYTLDILTLVNNDGEGFDIRNVFRQAFIKEGIEEGFVKGEIVVIDSVGLLENAKIVGQESLRIKMRHPGAEDAKDTIDKLFRVYKVVDVDRIDQNTQSFKLLFASPELLESKRKRVSQAFHMNILDMAAKIAEDYLGIENTLETAIESPKHLPHFEQRAKCDASAHVVIPNWTVFDTLNWLCSQAQDNSYESSLSDSYYFYETCNGGFRINSLRDMYALNFLNRAPFIYSDVNLETGVAWDDVNQGEVGHGKRIINYTRQSTANLLEGTTNGMFASKLTTLNSTIKVYQEKTYNFLERFYAKGEKSISADGSNSNSISQFPFVNTERESLLIGNPTAVAQDVVIRGAYREEGYDRISDYSAATQLLLSQSNFVHDVKGTVKSINHDSHFGASQTRMASRELLKYNTVQCLISNRTDISCGQLINLDITLPSPEGEAEFEPHFNTGDYLIKTIQWSFTPTTCHTDILCMKDSFENHLELFKPTYAPAEYRGDGAPGEAKSEDKNIFQSAVDSIRSYFD